MEWGTLARLVDDIEDMLVIATIAIILLILVIAVLGLAEKPPSVSCNCPVPVCPTPICEPIINLSCPPCTTKCERDNFSLVWVDMKKEHTYSEEYNCLNWANELARRYCDLGYNAYVRVVRVDCDSGLFEKKACTDANGLHAVVEVTHLYIDPAYGVIEPKDYKKYGIR